MRGDYELERLLAQARSAVLTAEQREAQRRSFAYGNVALENGRVTRALVDAQAERLPRPSRAPAR